MQEVVLIVWKSPLLERLRPPCPEGQGHVLMCRFGDCLDHRIIEGLTLRVEGMFHTQD